jgi:hypothetical protein
MKWLHNKAVAWCVIGLMACVVLSVPMLTIQHAMAASASTGTTSYRIPQTLNVKSIDEGAGTTFTLVSGVAGTRIQVWDAFLASNLTGATATVTTLSGSTQLTGAMPINAWGWDAPVGIPGQWFAFPKFVTNLGDDLKITLGASGTLTGQIKYTQQ